MLEREHKRIRSVTEASEQYQEKEKQLDWGENIREDHKVWKGILISIRQFWSYCYNDYAFQKDFWRQSDLNYHSCTRKNPENLLQSRCSDYANIKLVDTGSGSWFFTNMVTTRLNGPPRKSENWYQTAHDQKCGLKWMWLPLYNCLKNKNKCQISLVKIDQLVGSQIKKD